jgi:hypothetical protein
MLARLADRAGPIQPLVLSPILVLSTAHSTVYFSCMQPASWSRFCRYMESGRYSGSGLMDTRKFDSPPEHQKPYTPLFHLFLACSVLSPTTSVYKIAENQRKVNKYTTILLKSTTVWFPLRGNGKSTEGSPKPALIVHDLPSSLQRRYETVTILFKQMFFLFRCSYSSAEHKEWTKARKISLNTQQMEA